MKPVRLVLLAALTAFPTFGLAAQLLVLNKSDASLAFMDPVSGKTAATVATGDGPHEIEVSTDGRLAFVSNYGARDPGNSLSVVDIAARKEIKRVDLGEMRRPHGLTFANGRVYLTSEASKRVASYDPASQRIDWTFDVGQEGTHMILASRDGAKLFTSNMGSNSIGMLERGAGGEWAQTLIPVGAGPEGLDLSPDGRVLWSAHSRDGGISIIDTASGKLTHRFDARTQRSNRLKFTPDGRHVLVSDLTGGELLVIDAGKRTEVKRLQVGRNPTGILVAPGGREAFVAVSGENELAVIDLQKLAIARTIATGNNPDGMAWVP